MKVFLLVLALCAAVLAQPALEGVDFKVTPTLGDKYRSGLPLPLTVNLKNMRAESVDVKVVAQTGSGPHEGPRSETSLTMASGAKHAAQLLLPYGTYSPSVFLEVNGRATTTTPFSSNYADQQDLLTLLLTPQGTGFDYLGGYSPLLNGGTLVTNRPDGLANLPITWSAYAGHEMIVLQDRPALHLSPAAERALADWVRAGGALVLVSNLDPGEYRGSPLEDLLPLEPEGTRQEDARTYLRGQVRQARVLLAEDGVPLVVAGRREAGQVFLVTTPVLSQDSLGNRLTEQLWAYILHEIKMEASPLRAHRFDDNSNLLSRPPELPMPSAATLSWYLIGYVLLVGPVNYGLLRRKDRMLWIVFTVPLIALAFSVGAYGTNAWSRSSHTVLREVGILHVMAGSRHALLDGNLMIFSPRSRRYELDSPLSCYARPRGSTNPYGYNTTDENDYLLEVSPNGIKLKDFSATMWSARHFRTFEVREVPSTVQLKTGAQLEVRCPYNLTQAFVVQPRGVSGPFTVKKDQLLRTKVKATTVHDPPGASGTLAELLKGTLKAGTSWQPEDVDALAQMVQAYEPCLVGFTADDVASDLHLKDSGAEHHRLTLVVVHPEPKLGAPAPMPRPTPTPGASP